MFNVTVLKMKDIKKYLLGMLATIMVVFIISKYIPKNNNMLSCLKQTIPTVANTHQEYEQKANEKDVLKGVLKTQISSMQTMEDEENIEDSIEIDESTKQVATNEQDEQTQNIETAQTDLQTQVITNNPITEKYQSEYGKVKVKNETEFELTQDMLKPDITIENKNIVLFHTHSCESYTSSEKYQYTPTGTYRTTDLNYTVTRVGTELENQLKQYNYNVVHSTSYHDYPSYNGSYTRSLETVENILKTTPSDIVIDVHRDAIGSRSDYAPIVKIGENDVAAQIMFVIGTNNGGLWHPNWNQNLKFAVKIQEKAEEMYPGLFKPIMLTKSRYNQHTAKYASIIEVGATGNTLEQCLTSMKYLAKVMEEVMKL